MTVPFYIQFENRVIQTPTKVAIQFGDEEYSFSKLNQTANLIAKKITSRLELPIDNRVAIHSRRNHCAIASILACMKAGTTFVPIDRDYELNYKKYVFERAKPQLVLTDEPEEIDSEIQCEKLNVENFFQLAGEEDMNNLNICHSIDQDLMLLFTSGSTGSPKGVIHAERQKHIRFEWLKKDFPVSSSDVVGQRASLNFIPSFWEILGTLVSGAKLVIIPQNIIANPVSYIDFLRKKRITRTSFVPSLLQAIVHVCEREALFLTELNFISIAGEPLSQKLVDRLKVIAPNSRILNEYGTTEADGITFFPIDCYSSNKFETVPIGYPIPGVEVQIIDQNNYPTPKGEIGELAVNCKSTGIGYFDEPLLNERSFTHLRSHPGKDKKFFKTRDLVRMTSDGVIQIVGRVDNQIKRNGYRIELEDLEGRTRQILECENAIYTEKLQAEGSLLVLFLLKSEFEKKKVEEIVSSLKQSLPSHLIPEQVRVVNEYIRTPTGKVDRGRMKKLASEQSRGRKKLPRKSIYSGTINVEAKFKEILRSKLRNAKTLDCERSLSENGIDSLNFLKLSLEAEEAFGVPISIRHLFESGSVDECIQYLEQLINGRCSSDFARIDTGEHLRKLNLLLKDMPN